MRWILAVALCGPMLAAVVLDRIAIVVENRVIKDSDIEREARVAEFINGERLNLSAAQRKKAASRLIDQAIIGREIDLGKYPEASPEETEKLLKDTLKSRPAPSTYGITVEQLRRALRWQLTVLRFMELRFPRQPDSKSLDDPFISWLDESRKAARIEYHEEELR